LASFREGFAQPAEVAIPALFASSGWRYPRGQFMIWIEPAKCGYGHTCVDGQEALPQRIRISGGVLPSKPGGPDELRSAVNQLQTLLYAE